MEVRPDNAKLIRDEEPLTIKAEDNCPTGEHSSDILNISQKWDGRIPKPKCLSHVDLHSVRNSIFSLAPLIVEKSVAYLPIPGEPKSKHISAPGWHSP